MRNAADMLVLISATCSATVVLATYPATKVKKASKLRRELTYAGAVKLVLDMSSTRMQGFHLEHATMS